MWQAYLRSLSVPTLLLTWVAASAFGVLGGPFGTFEWLTVGERLVYWPSLWALGITIGCALRLLYEEVLQIRNFWSYALLEASSLGLLMAFPYHSLLHYLAEIDHAHLPSLLQLGAYNFVMTFFCVSLRRLFYPESKGSATGEDEVRPVSDRQSVAPQADAASYASPADPEPAFSPDATREPELDALTTPRLLQRLPKARQGDIWHLQSRDHYVHVTTSKGSHQVLIRLADAMAELEGVQGLQVHRSHWVAEEAVAEGRKLNSKAELTLRNGAVIPVSRTYLSDAEDAGFFDLDEGPQGYRLS
ncbi:LytTR family DNA-binding domain-containing protein [Thioclava sp. 'Guangxiensis']|uniref:LytTR family DNA-binding domain-containing protein n=1 Tax=Thioclava sp. 'Guangxiensis' TaxID=3149044 RepID=UPI003877B697